MDVGVLGIDLSPNDVVMSWLKLQQASEWIPHPDLRSMLFQYKSHTYLCRKSVDLRSSLALDLWSSTRTKV